MCLQFAQPRADHEEQRTPFQRADYVSVLALFAGALLLRAGTAAVFRFDGLYGQDPFAYYDFAADWARGQMPAAFFWPLGYPALLAALFRAFGTSAAAAQAASLLLGALLPALVYALTRQMGGGRGGALFAGGIMAVCGQAVQSSLVVMADMPALFWATLSALCLWRAAHAGKRGLVAAALLLALACVSRWLYLALWPAWALALFAHKGDFARGGRAALLAVWVAAGLIFLPQAVYSRTNPYPTLNHAWVQGWSPANAFTQEFFNADGHFVYTQPNALYYAQAAFDPYYLPLLWTPLLIVGTLALWRRRAWRALRLLLAWALLPYLFLAGIPYQNIRFPLIVMPALAILAGLGFSALGEQVLPPQTKVCGCRTSRLAFKSLRDSLRVPALLSLSDLRVKLHNAIHMLRGVLRPVLLAALITFGLWQAYQASSALIPAFLARQQQDRAAAVWAAARIPAGARLYTFNLTLTLRHYTTLEVFDLYYETPATLAAAGQTGQPAYLLIDSGNITRQWQGRAPHIAYAWLDERRGLRRLAQYGAYTLFRVGG
ncbi:MAG: glycosyltransferase family 39 protein [Chloroflexi bacterium]|nr:glycosyltransferase family 39 protein [Chloroflexota bacterium]